RFVPERARPDKAIDVLDEACAHAQAAAQVSPALDHLIRERRKVDAMIRRGLTHETPATEPAEDLVAEIFPMLERIGVEIEKMLREELEHQGIVVRGQDIARAVGASVGKSIEWQE